MTATQSATDSPADIPALTLVTLGGAFDMRNVSPFCLKIEMLMKSLALDFDLKEQPDPRNTPKGKLPYLEVEGNRLPDSELITEYLNELANGAVYAGLTTQQQAYGVALARLAEDHLYWMMVASRWLDDNWWPNVVEGFFQIAPAVIRPLVAGAARRQVRQTYDLHGLGRHSISEQHGFAKRDLRALENAIEGQVFLFGEKPNIFDFTVAGVMSGIYDNRPPTWLTGIAQAFPALQAYTERVQEHTGVYGRK